MMGWPYQQVFGFMDIRNDSAKIRRQDASCPAAFAYELSFWTVRSSKCEAAFFL
jgi:hypothetical protein